MSLPKITGTHCRNSVDDYREALRAIGFPVNIDFEKNVNDWVLDPKPFKAAVMEIAKLLHFVSLRVGETRFSKTAACAMAALSVPMPSGVFALIPTQSAGIPHNSATCLRIASACGPIFGVERISVESRLTSS